MIMNYGPVGVDGLVTIKGLELAEVGDSLLLAFNVEVKARAMNNRQSWRIVPQLSAPTTGQSIELPALLITGRQKERHFKRKERFGNRWLMENYPGYKTTIPEGTDTVLQYRTTVPYEYWMDNAHLNIYQYLASPREKRQLFSSGSYGTVTLQKKEPYIVQPQVSYIRPKKEVKRRSVGHRALVDFPVNVSRIIPDFRRNPEELAVIDKQIRLIKDNPHIDIETIYMEGYASPEGSNSLNQRLSAERVEALKMYFVEKHGIDANIINMKSVTEDWNGLRTIVDSWPEGNGKERILAAIDSPEEPDVKEQRLRALPEWRSLVNEAFLYLRRTEYRIEFRVRDFTVEQSRSLIKSNPEIFSRYELFMLAMSFEDEPERLEHLETIVRNYPDDDIAINNYAASLIVSGEIASAKRYLEKISDKTLAANNLGIVYLLMGEYEEAMRWFRASTTDEAVYNLEELQKKLSDNITMDRYNNR